MINLFYLIHIQDTETVIVFLLSGFVISFFIQNMIIIISFAILISLIFHYWPILSSGRLPSVTVRYLENFANEAEMEETEQDGGETHETDVEETFKYQYQGQPDPKNGSEKKTTETKMETEKTEVEETFHEDEDDDKIDKKSNRNTTEIRKDMAKYYEIQNKLLDLLEQAEPLQKQAETFKEKFQNK